MKRIEVVEMKVRDLKKDFGNPRKISKRKRDELRKHLEELNDFGIVLIDENDNIIGGNQRVSVLYEMDPDTIVLCKRLIGYTKSELKAINIIDNTHAGEWDLDALADWNADIQLDLGFETASQNDSMQDRRTKEMELIHYEKYDYVMIVCKHETDYLDLCRKLGIEGKKIAMTKKRKIKARAIWYDDVQCDIRAKEE
ncbi:MAG: hypothetical protein IKP95_09300 [Ruminococcus sp.]|nr:hypothetical protein [Ruminococcus sp.]